MDCLLNVRPAKNSSMVLHRIGQAPELEEMRSLNEPTDRALPFFTANAAKAKRRLKRSGFGSSAEAWLKTTRDIWSLMASVYFDVWFGICGSKCADDWVHIFC